MQYLKKDNTISISEKVPVTIYTTASEASIIVARIIADLINQKNAKGEFAVLGLATGSTPKMVYNELINLYNTGEVSFKKVIAFNLDEYYGLTKEDTNSYKFFMWHNFFSKIDIEIENCHIPSGAIDDNNILFHCGEYEKKIELVGGIDIQLLGIGRNGHIGFNEPGSHANSQTRLITLDTTTRADASADFGGMTHVPKKAITMGVSTILKAKKIILLAWGENKAGIVKEAIEGPENEAFPASYLQRHADAKFVIDEACACELSRVKSPWLFDNILWDKTTLKRAVTALALQLNKPILKLTNSDYNENGLSDLLALFGNAYDINIEVFNLLQHTITGWPGGKPNASDDNRPERATPEKKRVLIFSPHPDDDIISMGGTFQRLVDQGHEVHVAYQTSGNIAVADDEALRFIEFTAAFAKINNDDNKQFTTIYSEAKEFLKNKKNGTPDTELIRTVKGLIRKGEAYNTCRFVGIPDEQVHYLIMPFYETGTIEKKALGKNDYQVIQNIITEIQPHQIYAAGDLADPHGTHKVCLDAIFEAVISLKNEPFINDCWVWLYKGAWAEWSIDQIEMAVPMSPEQVLKKRYGIFKHQSQKDGVVFQGKDNREFWQRAEDRNRQTASLYNKLGLAEYEAMEAFVRWKY